jgi:hypothetical protein
VKKVQQWVQSAILSWKQFHVAVLYVNLQRQAVKDYAIVDNVLDHLLEEDDKL